MSKRPKSEAEDEPDESEDYCSVCGEGGDLLCCENCPRVYHIKCVKLKRAPKGAYLCEHCLAAALAQDNKDLLDELSRSVAKLDKAQEEIDEIDGFVIRSYPRPGGKKRGS